MNEQEIIERIRTLYPDAAIELSGENCSFEVYVVTEAFAGVKALERQRGILGLFDQELATAKLHALSVKAKTPAELGGNSGLVQIGG